MILPSPYKLKILDDGQKRLELEQILVQLPQKYLALWAIEAIDYRAALDKCKIPTLLLAGDFSGKLVQMMKTTKEHLSHVQNVVIADSFDPSNLCQPAKFNALVENFVKQVFEERF